jgi:hypothetical protein
LAGSGIKSVSAPLPASRDENDGNSNHQDDEADRVGVIHDDTPSAAIGLPTLGSWVGIDVGKKTELAENCWNFAVLAEPEGFEPSIGLYNPITV